MGSDRVGCCGIMFVSTVIGGIIWSLIDTWTPQHLRHIKNRIAVIGCLSLIVIAVVTLFVTFMYVIPAMTAASPGGGLLGEEFN